MGTLSWYCAVMRALPLQKSASGLISSVKINLLSLDSWTVVPTCSRNIHTGGTCLKYEFDGGTLHTRVRSCQISCNQAKPSASSELSTHYDPTLILSAFVKSEMTIVKETIILVEAFEDFLFGSNCTSASAWKPRIEKYIRNTNLRHQFSTYDCSSPLNTF